MPELPDVATFRLRMARAAVGHAVTAMSLDRPEQLRGATPRAFADRVRGHACTRTHRHGKYLFAAIGRGWVELHFGMDGALEMLGPPGAPPRGTVARFRFAEGDTLAFTHPRRLGHIAWIADPDTRVAETGLGPNALGLDRTTFTDRLADRRAGIKASRMDQANIAGVGNIYSDEILFHAGLHPKRTADTLDPDETQCLFAALQEALQGAVRARADPRNMPPDFLLPHRTAGEHCPSCGGALQHGTVAGRSAWWCPPCQPRGRG